MYSYMYIQLHTVFMNYTTGDTDYVRGPLITFLTDTFTKLYDILRILYFVKHGHL